jgi:hypothetical protein
MGDVTSLLRDADPIGGTSARQNEEELSAGDAQRMRYAMLAAAREAPAPKLSWRRPLAVAAVLTAAIALGSVTGHQAFKQRPPAARAAQAVFPGPGGSSDGTDRRQLQFATPGGTRIIWIFDDSLRLQESMR